MKLKIGTKLRSIRESRGLKQFQMAELLNMAEATYSRYERNETQIDMENLTKVSELLNVPIQEFFPETFHIYTTNSGNGQAGLVMGNYVYYGVEESAKHLLEENKKLKKQNEELKKEQKLFIESLEAIKKEIDELKKK